MGDLIEILLRKKKLVKKLVNQCMPQSLIHNIK